MPIRFPVQSDLPAISCIIEETELFPSELLGGMIAPFLNKQTVDEQWFVYDDEELGVAAVAYCREEPFTDGTWNLLAIGVRARLQGRGIGAALVKHVERALSTARLLLVETSGTSAFEETRAFYVKCGYDLVATLPDYWAEGDDKVVFSKPLP